jgi:hypothetical protein
MPGDGVLMYPGKDHTLPSIRLAQVRDGVEDYEWLQLAAAKAGAATADAESRTLIESMTKFTRDPAALRAARTRLADLIDAR